MIKVEEVRQRSGLFFFLKYLQIAGIYFLFNPSHLFGLKKSRGEITTASKFHIQWVLSNHTQLLHSPARLIVEMNQVNTLREIVYA